MTPLFEKLNYKSQEPILIWKAPESFRGEMTRSGIRIDQEVQVSNYGFALAFTTSKAELTMVAEKFKAHTSPGAVLWIAYPKLTSKTFKTELNRDVCREHLAGLGLDAVRQVAIDDDWSALRYKQLA